jgi:hypothetical protein
LQGLLELGAAGVAAMQGLPLVEGVAPAMEGMQPIAMDIVPPALPPAPPPSKAEAEVDLGRLSPSARLKHGSLKLLLQASLGSDPAPAPTRREQAVKDQAVVVDRLPKRKWADTSAPTVKAFGLDEFGDIDGSDLKRPKPQEPSPAEMNVPRAFPEEPRVLRGIASADGFDDSLIMKSTIKKSKVCALHLSRAFLP